MVRGVAAADRGVVPIVRGVDAVDRGVAAIDRGVAVTRFSEDRSLKLCAALAKGEVWVERTDASESLPMCVEYTSLFTLLATGSGLIACFASPDF
jgi:hypothetical protein